MKSNKPYTKQYDEDGNLINPIDNSYENQEPNRKTRRDYGNKLWAKMRKRKN
jgi:hypothetical protein